ncbi:fungal-specific transcription factor domain-containing protein [Talaromyces proteolyticus]|uniref:Fungal-specific transcription factor domain-containing protein n=1 Tax=Talaromyces proteolyticus TaxID=1131652 RepID=A0AAD4KV09_9EURO|nr:fungal-specific transcription factor domain-containing protein [Talaromyces proteolyticus]KAH8700495.1 fungal-specific transcription factor domain-containing protein [Talaromyces proteolyticus]
MQSSDILPRTTELGSLIAHSNDESEFVGSSSGVFFVNTVRQAFAKSLGPLDNFSSGPGFPAAEDTIIGQGSSSFGERHDAARDETINQDSEGNARLRRKWIYDPDIVNVLGVAPSLEHARQLMMMYFRVWHPIFPFLHGPSFLQEMEAFYSRDSIKGDHQSKTLQHQSTCWTTIFQCIFNLASFLQPDNQLAPESRIQSAPDAPKLVGLLLYRHDNLSLQALLAMQLYLIATMSLRNASLVGGSILRSVLHVGLHRCPYRYKELTSHDRHLRKRIFWCVYAIDRYLSQALGLPLGIQDSDIDVCLPGASEAHAPGGPHIPQGSSSLHDGSDDASISRSSVDWTCDHETRFMSPSFRNTTQKDKPDSKQQEQLNREATLFSYVMYGKLTGRALELFHKSVQNRQIRRSSVLYLVSDVHKWWNNLPSSLQGVDNNHRAGNSDEPTGEPFDLSPFFSILYEHLILCINRPCLSLDPASPDFCSSLQTCIGSARNILSSLKTQLAKHQPLFWPGLLSAAYMSGLVIAFACQLKQHVLSKGCQEIRECLEILQSMSKQWETAKHCHTALSFLLLNIQRMNQCQDTLAPFNFEEMASRQSESFRHENRGRSKRRKIDHSSHEASNATLYNENGIQNEHNTIFPTDTQSVSAAQEPYNSQGPSKPRQPLTTQNIIQQRQSATYESPHSIDLSQYSPLLMLDGNRAGDLQWPGASTMTTNFDLNMTDLFQDSTWDPSLFDAFAQGQLPTEQDHV